MEAWIQHILGMLTPIKKKSLINSFTDLPFVDAIALVEMPRKFSFPNMKHYNGTTDPDDHIDKYRQRIKGLLHHSDLYKKLTKYPCKTMEDVMDKSWTQIKWEEDEVNYTPSSCNRNDERCSRRVERKSAEHRPEPYPTNRPPRQPERTRARVPEYNLSITPVEAVAAIQNLGNSVKWPERMLSLADKRDLTKWCDFHGDHSYRTEDCIALKFEVVKLLKRGHLKEHLTDKGKNTLARRDER
ncbi:hypothetical protein ACOSQ3_007693 [Xanthoceras sorbifolium]